MALRLYELSDEYKFLEDNLVNEETGEIDEAALNRLNELDRPLQEKCINTVRAMKGIQAEYKAIEAERKAMQAREKSLKALVDWIENYLLTNMEKTSIREIKCDHFVIRLKKNPPSVDLYDENAILSKYQKISISHDKIAISQDLKAGIDVPGARLVQKNSLSIK